MHILFLNDNPLPKIFNRSTISAKELRLRSALPQVRSITALGFSGQAVTSGTNGTIGPLEKKITTIRLPPWPYYFRCLPLLLYGATYLKKHPVDLIEAESPIISGVAAVLLSKLHRKPAIIEVRASYHRLIALKLKFIPHRLKQLLLDLSTRFVYSHATAIIANSHTYAARLKPYRTKTFVINPGLQYAPAQTTRPRSAQILTIGFLGRLVPEKGVDLLLRAFSRLPKDISVRARLEIAGTGPDLDRLKKLSGQLGINQQVSFLGQVHNYRTLQRWHILVNPNLVMHPLEMVNAEAAYMQVPVICFGQGRIPETVIHLKTGLKISPPSDRLLTDALVKLITHQHLRQRLGSQGHRFALDHFDFNVQVSQIDSIYRHLQLY